MVAFKLRDGRVVRPAPDRSGEKIWRLYTFSEPKKRGKNKGQITQKRLRFGGLINDFDTEADADATLRALIRTAQKLPSSVLFAAEELR
jgi:hypothetical protein